MPTLHKSWSFPLRISSVNVTKSAWKCELNTHFFIRTINILPSFNVIIIFCQFEPQVFLFLFLFIYVIINCNLYTWQSLHSLPVEKAGNFPFQKGKKRNLKAFRKCKSIVYNKLLIDAKLFLWYIFLFLTEHNPSLRLFLICSYFFTHSELRCSYKVCSYKKECISRVWGNTYHWYIWWFNILDSHFGMGVLL